MPCYNEGSTISESLNSVLNVQLEIEKELLIIDDYSTDGTREYLQSIAGRDKNIKIICHAQNQGKGAALRTGYKEASGDIILIQDTDLEYAPNEYHKLLRPIIENKADEVYGSLLIGGVFHCVLFYL